MQSFFNFLLCCSDSRKNRDTESNIINPNELEIDETTGLLTSRTKANLNDMTSPSAKAALMANTPAGNKTLLLKGINLMRHRPWKKFLRTTSYSCRFTGSPDLSDLVFHKKEEKTTENIPSIDLIDVCLGLFDLTLTEAEKVSNQLDRCFTVIFSNRSWLFFESESHDDAVAWVQALSWLKDFVNGCPGSLDENDEKMSLISHTPVVSYAYDKSAKFQQEVGVAKIREPIPSHLAKSDQHAFILKKGQCFLRYSKRSSKPFLCYMWCSADLNFVLTGKQRGNSSKQHHADDLQQLGLGQDCELFGVEKWIFSVFFKADEDLEGSLHFACESKEEREQWVNALRWLKDTHSKIGTPYNVQKIAYLDADLNWQGNDVLNQFRFGKTLGKGGFCEVIEGEHLSTGSKLAIKKFEEGYELKGEMDILKKARHRSIVSYFGSLFNDGKQYLLMEYCDGGSLYDLIHRSKETLLEAHIAFIISCVIDALYYLHGTRVVHCDVKAANILLNKNGTVKLSDFGISEMLGTHERGRIAGSPLWMAPETICGSEPTFKSDIWSLGITALELAETRPPHYGTKSLPEIIRAINESDPPTLRLPEQWSDDFRGFLALVLVKDAAKRPTAQELLRHPFVMMGRMNSPLLNQGDDSFTSYIEFGVYTYAKHFPDRLKGFDTARNRQPSSSSSTTGNLFSRLFNLTSKSLTRGESSKLTIDSSKPAPLRRESRDRSLSKDGSKSTDELSAALSSSASLSHVKLLSSSSSDSRSLTSTTSTLSNTAGLINRSVSSSALSSADIMELPRGTQLLNRRSLIPLKVLQETAALSLTNSIIQLQGDTPPRRGSVSGQSPLLGSVTSSNLLRRRKETDTVEETPEVDLLRIKSILGLQANDSPERNPATPGSDTSPKMSNSSPSSSVLPTGSPALSPMTTPSLAGRSPSFLSLKVSDATVTWRKPMLQQLLIEEDNEDYVLELENGDVLSSLPSVRTNQAVEIDHARTYVITAQGNLSTHGFEISSKGIIKSPDMHFPSEVESAGSAPSSKGVRSADANASSRFFANSAPSSNSASPSGSAPGSPLEKPKRRSFSRERQTEMNNTERMAAQLCREDLVDLAVIGRGQNGNVVKALHVPSLSLVAIKTMNVFDQGTRHQLVKELAAYSKLSGPHLVSFLGAYFHDGTISLTSEFMDCGSLHHFVAVNGPLDEELLRYVTREIVLGLRYLHGARQLHRDIKPENILLDRHANVKIADFGLLRELDSEQQTANTFMGTLNYLSPERITSGTYSYPSDIWALGMTIMHAATGQMSVTTHDYWAVADSVLHKPQPSLPSTFSADLRSFVDSCLARDPAQRGSAEELLKHPFLAIPSPPDVMSRKEWNISQGANIDSLTKIVDVMLAGYFKDENGSYLRDILVESDYIYHVADTLNVPSRLVADTFLTRLQAACPGQPVTMKIVRAEAPEGDDAASSHNIGSATSTGSMLFQELDWSSL